MLGIVLTPEQQAIREGTLAAARAQLGDESFEAAWTEAQKRSTAVSQTDEKDEKTLSPTEEALSSKPLTDPLEATQTRVSTHASGLSSREREVLRLVANGMTNEQIADKLVLSIRTVHAHMRSKYKKLEISSRSALIRYAIDNHFG
jgi:DNA-binding NarL/FixJ family response regulator